MLYVLDTSALIDAWIHDYSPENFLPLWEKIIVELAKASELTVPENVLLELYGKDDELRKWVQGKKDYLCTTTLPEIQKLANEIANKHPNIGSKGIGSKNFADVYVIATAEYLGGTVVTSEGFTGNIDGPKLPDVARYRNIRVIKFNQIIRDLGLKFDLAP